MIWKETSTITTTAIKILAAIADSCLVVCFIAWKERFCELLWFILSCWKFLDLTSQSYLVKAEFVQMVLTMARLPDGSFLNNWYYAFAKCLPFKKVSVGIKVLALEKKVQITELTACGRDNKNHIKNTLLANENFWCWILVCDQNIVLVVLCLQKRKLCGGKYAKYSRVTSGQRWYVKWWR